MSEPLPESDPLDNSDLDDFEYVTEADFEDDFFSQLDSQGQPIEEPSVSLRMDSTVNSSLMSVDNASAGPHHRLEGNNGNLPEVNLSRQGFQYSGGILAEEPQSVINIAEVQAVLDRMDNPGQVNQFDVPLLDQEGRGLDERAINFGSLSQETYSDMNVDSPAGSQAGVSGFSVPIQFPSQPSSQGSDAGSEDGLGSLSQEINRTVPQWTSSQLGNSQDNV